MVWEVWKRHSQHTWFCHCYLLSLLEAVAAWGWFWWGWKISCRCLRHSSLPWLEHLKARNWGIQRCHPPLVVCTTTSRQSHFSHFTRSLWFREITNHYLPLSLVFWWHLGWINGSPKHHQVTLENSNIKLVCMYCVVCMYVLLWEGETSVRAAGKMKETNGGSKHVLLYSVSRFCIFPE